RLGEFFLGENRPGAGGKIGTKSRLNAPPRGHTFLFAPPPHPGNATLHEKHNFHFIPDITPRAGHIRVSMVILVPPSVPATTVPELSPMRSAIQARSTWPRLERAARRTWPGSFSTSWRACTWSRSPIVARDLRFAWRTGAGLFRDHSRNK